MPWWAYMIVVCLIAVTTSPFALMWLRGRTGAYQARQQGLVAWQTELDGRRSAFVAELQAAEADARDRLARERVAWSAERAAWNTERATLVDDRDEGWDLARGMEDVAHVYRHDLASLGARFNALLTMLGDLIAGRMVPERAKALFDQVKPAQEPQRVPALRDVVRKRPTGAD